MYERTYVAIIVIHYGFKLMQLFIEPVVIENQRISYMYKVIIRLS